MPELEPDPEDEEGNNILATGALWAALAAAQVAEPLGIEHLEGNMLSVRFGFLHSAYRVTVTRIKGSEED